MSPASPGRENTLLTVTSFSHLVLLIRPGAVHGRTVEPSDLQFLTDEDVEEIGRPVCRAQLYAEQSIQLTLNPQVEA